MNNINHSHIEQAAKYIKSVFKMEIPRIAVVLGSGLGGFTQVVKALATIKYKDIPNFPHGVGVDGHKGNLTIATTEAGKKVLIMEGRFHYYQGYTAAQVAFPIAVLALLGVEVLIVSNASGGCNPNFKKGDLMIITDHINLTGNHPLIGENNADYGPRFLDQTEPYNRELIQRAKDIAYKLNLKPQEGIYVGVSGPTYETKAEVRMCQILGADAVGMSTIYEVIMANYFKMQVLGIASITNMATGLSNTKHEHHDIVDAANLITAAFSNWVKHIIQDL